MKIKPNESITKDLEAMTVRQPDEVAAMRKTGLSVAEVEELTSRFKGMGEAELELFMDLIPVDLCIKKIQKELDRAKEFEAAIKVAMSGR